MTTTTSNTQAKTNKQTKTPKGAKVHLTQVDESNESLAEGLKVFGKDLMMKALDKTITAMSEVRGGDTEIRKLEGEILLKREGNGAKLWNLAKECVALVMEDGKADLGKAAELMRLSCEYVESKTVEDFKAQNPEATAAKIKDIAPSWYAMRSVVTNSMKKAKIDPNAMPGYTAIEKGYKAWKADPANSGEVQQSGPQGPRGARTPDTKAGNTTSTPAATVGDKMRSSLTASAKSMLDNITVALQQLDEKQQAKAVSILTAALGQIRNLAGKEDGVKTTKVVMPARETAGAGATAE